MKRALIGMLVVLLAFVSVLPVLAQDGGQDAIAFLKTVQNEDGGFSNGFTPESDISTTADAVVAITAGGEDANAFFIGDMMNPLVFLATQVEAGNLTGAGQLAKVLTAVVASGKDPTAFGGHQLIEDLLATQAEDGSFGTGAFDHCLSLIALQNTQTDLPEGAVDALVKMQGEDGGWGFSAGEASDTNTTALCLQALALTDQADAVQAGLDYLKPIQNEDGGWPYQNPSDFGTASDANSTALVIQALVANGQDLAAWNNPQDYLSGLQVSGGAFIFQPEMSATSVIATVAAIPALEQLPLNNWSGAYDTAE